MINDYKEGKLNKDKFLILLQISLAIYKLRKEEKEKLCETLLKINNLNLKYKDFIIELTRLDDGKIRSYVYELVTKKDYESSNRKL